MLSVQDGSLCLWGPRGAPANYSLAQEGDDDEEEAAAGRERELIESLWAGVSPPAASAACFQFFTLSCFHLQQK